MTRLSLLNGLVVQRLSLQARGSFLVPRTPPELFSNISTSTRNSFSHESLKPFCHFLTFLLHAVYTLQISRNAHHEGFYAKAIAQNFYRARRALNGNDGRLSVNIYRLRWTARRTQSLPRTTICNATLVQNSVLSSPPQVPACLTNDFQTVSTDQHCISGLQGFCHPPFIGAVSS